MIKRGKQRGIRPKLRNKNGFVRNGLPGLLGKEPCPLGHRFDSCQIFPGSMGIVAKNIDDLFPCLRDVIGGDSRKIGYGKNRGTV